jgi:hypothetical protein
MLLKNEIFNLQATDGNRARYWYRCRNEGCECDSPTRETAEEAYKAAMKRRQEPNRVLTLDELQTYIGYAWYEGDHKWYHSSFDYPVWIENGKYNYEGDLYDIPDVEGRFWLRKPTEDEREAAKWLPEEKKNKKDGEDDE